MMAGAVALPEVPRPSPATMASGEGSDTITIEQTREDKVLWRGGTTVECLRGGAPARSSRWRTEQYSLTGARMVPHREWRGKGG
jgi:hypothetical protein